MKNTIVPLLAAGALMAASASTAAAVTADGHIRFIHHKVSKANYTAVTPDDLKSNVEIVWGHEGHRTNAWTNAHGVNFRTKTYPTETPKDSARAVFRQYNATTWVLAKTKWCVPDTDPGATSPVVCSPNIPGTPAPPPGD